MINWQKKKKTVKVSRIIVLEKIIEHIDLE